MSPGGFSRVALGVGSDNPIFLSQAERRVWQLECRGNAPEPGGVEICAQFNPGNFGASETAGQGEVLDAVSPCLATLLDSETYIDAVSARGNVQLAHRICHELTPINNAPGARACF